jgi:hypothetical protein
MTTMGKRCQAIQILMFLIKDSHVTKTTIKNNRRRQGN